MSNLQVLISTMHQQDHQFIKSMNLNSDAIIINQTNTTSASEVIYENHTIQFYSFSERGVGLSRNNALMRATADICILADDDVMYDEGYGQKIIQSFKSIPDADVIIFNLPSLNPDRPEYIIKKKTRVRKLNSLRYGASRIAFRTHKLHSTNVTFSLLFGGGAKYSSGEDSMFVYQCIQAGLKVYAVPDRLGTLRQEESTWFEGYTTKFFLDKGSFFKNLSPRMALIYAWYYAVRNYKKFNTDMKLPTIIRLLNKGVKQYGQK